MSAACSALGDGLGVTGWWVVCAVTAVKVSPGPASAAADARELDVAHRA